MEWGRVGWCSGSVGVGGSRLCGRVPIEESVAYITGCRSEPCKLPVGTYAHPGVTQEDDVMISSSPGISIT